ncbi:MAG: hypothetical protein R2765_10100 [Ferruginibacter sp.]
MRQDPTVKGLKDEAAKTINKDPKDTTQKTCKTAGLFNLNINHVHIKQLSAGR